MDIQLIDKEILNNLKEQMKIDKKPIDYLNICSFLIIIFIPFILYYRYITKKKRKEIIMNHINNINHYLD